LSLFLAYLFPVQNTFQGFSRIIFFMLLLPILYIKLILKKDLFSFGLNLHNQKAGFLWSAGMLLALGILAGLLFHFFSFEKYVSLPNYVLHNFWLFVFYELVLINILFFITEFFFHGFLLSSLQQKLGVWSILLQFLILFIFASALETPSLKSLPSLAISLIGGFVSYKTKSFIYAYLGGFLFIFFFDAYIIHILNK